VAAARSKSKGNKSPMLDNKGTSADSPDRKPTSSPLGSPRDSPRAQQNASSAGGGPVPPPLPKKKTLAKEELVDFVFCVECGARNKSFRKQCVSCNEDLEIPQGVVVPKKVVPWLL
jgi:ribosomal protein L40E